MPDPTAGERFGPYVKLAPIGRGGMGEVWRARDTRLSREVALKLMLHDDGDDRQRFLREAQTAASLSHPGIASIYEVGEHDGRRYIAMQLIEGKPMARPCPPRDAARIVRDVALAAAYAHARGVIHRDFKPDNIMIDGAGHAYALDFGLARRVTTDASLTQSGVMVGTPAYMSPEQARGERATAASDVYALGATLHHAVSGTPPFDDDELVTL